MVRSFFRFRQVQTFRMRGSGEGLRLAGYNLIPAPETFPPYRAHGARIGWQMNRSAAGSLTAQSLT
ncbi:MAG: hypothetical protein WCK89_09920, partial [bacterium]